MKKRFCLVLLAGLISACASTPEIAVATRDFVQIPYADDARTYFDVTRPADNQQRPGVLIIHGGGWARGEPADMAKFVERVVSSGWVAINLSYRLAPEHTWPAQRQDLHRAMGVIHQRAEEFGLDSQRIAILGYSAGAHLAAVAALQPNPRVPRPVALAAGAGAYDLTKYPQSRLVNGLMGGIPSVVGPAAYREASPLYMVSRGALPSYLWHGSWDILVGVEQSRDFAAALQAQGVEVEFDERFGLGHYSNFLADGKSWERMHQFLSRYLNQ